MSDSPSQIESEIPPVPKSDPVDLGDPADSPTYQSVMDSYKRVYGEPKALDDMSPDHPTIDRLKRPKSADLCELLGFGFEDKLAPWEKGKTTGILKSYGLWADFFNRKERYRVVNRLKPIAACWIHALRDTYWIGEELRDLPAKPFTKAHLRASAKRLRVTKGERETVSSGTQVTEKREVRKFMQLARGRDATLLDAVRWAARNIPRSWHEIDPESIPDDLAVSFLVWAKTNPGEFHRSFTSRLFPSRQALEAASDRKGAFPEGSEEEPDLESLMKEEE